MNQTGFPLFSFPFPMQQGNSGEDTPPRVQAAMELLRDLTLKTMSRAAISDVVIEVLPGQALCRSENQVRDDACTLLSNYFRGELQPDFWEKLQLPGESNQNQWGGIPGQLVRCPACYPDPARSSCPMCNGAGQVMVFPVKEAKS